MDTSKVLFGIYLFLAVYCAGSMMVLQLQHFSLYSKVGADSFKSFIDGNNKASFLPAILPALLLFIVSLILLSKRPAFLSPGIIIASVVLNVINIASSIFLQARYHATLANTGYDETIIKRLVSTNWIRTIALFVQGIIAVCGAVGSIK